MPHTPGPWNRIAESIEDRDGNSIAMVTGGSGTQYIDDEDNAEGLANARLIEAAPALLESLEVMTSFCRIKYGNLDKDVYAEIVKAEAAIAAARGEATA